MADYGFKNNSEVIELYHNDLLLASIDNDSDNGETSMVRNNTTKDLEIYAKGDLAIILGDI